jgi:hypothetical protein
MAAINIIPTLINVHRAREILKGKEWTGELADAADSAMSIVAFNMKEPRAVVSNVQESVCRRLEELVSNTEPR